MKLPILSLFFFILAIGCESVKDHIPQNAALKCSATDSIDFVESSIKFRSALLASRINSMDDLQKLVKIQYFDKNGKLSEDTSLNVMVRLTQCTVDKILISELKKDVSQTDIVKARDGNIWDKLSLLFSAPSVISNRMDLKNIYIMARWRQDMFGFGDVAFYDLAEAALYKINTPDLAFASEEDSAELGYINSFNHITAQALITSCYSEEVADFIADAHERYNMPELTSGNFSKEQLLSKGDNPVDNYVDMINNEWGQEIGKELKEKYKISLETHWTPELLTNYLNELQSFYSWAFQIGMKPFNPDEEVILRFTDKINSVIKKSRY